MNNLPTPEELQQAWEELCGIHSQYLERYEVKLPNSNRYNERAKSIWLAVLHYYRNEHVHKNLISQICQRDNSRLGADQQVRHLKRDGWHLTGTGGEHLLDPYQPSPEWVTDQKRREGRLDATTFNELQAVYGGRCATCGAEAGKPSPRYGEDIVELQQGHKDPSQPHTLDNIIPQCQFCNRAYRGDFTFDDKGRVRAVADVGPVQRATQAVQRKILQWLRNRFGLF